MNYNEVSIPYVSAVIVAAGGSTRMNMGVCKQLIPINGIPVIAHTVLAFEQSKFVQEIIVVCREEDRQSIQSVLACFTVSKLSGYVNGGAARQESVFNGIHAVSKQAQYYAIHDGARPLIMPEDIDRVIVDAFTQKASALGVPVKDTIKIIDQDGFIAFTPERSSLWAVQTPQVFEKSLYQNAMQRALEEQAEYTDDCQLVENMGSRVHLCMGSYTNIKITTKDDIQSAEAILKSREI